VEKVQVLSMLLSVALVLFVLHLIRKRHLREQYSLLWLLFGIIMFVLSINTGWLNRMAAAVNVFYAPSLLFLAGIILCFLLILHLTVVVSKQTERIIRLTQELALMRGEMDKIRQESGN
jgi:hypothetical protein